MKLVSWNVNGLKLAMESGIISYILDNDFDIVCLQETRVKSVDLEKYLPGYRVYANSAQWSKYSGTYTLVKGFPNYVTSGLDSYSDIEGRAQIINVNGLIIINCYAPFAAYRMARIGEKIRYMDALYETVKRLCYQAPVIVCGDLNIAHECGLESYFVRKVPGFYVPEKDAFRKLLSLGFSDVVVPHLINEGVSGVLDHFLIPNCMKGLVKRVYINKERDHTTHLPVELELKI